MQQNSHARQTESLGDCRAVSHRTGQAEHHLTTLTANLHFPLLTFCLLNTSNKTTKFDRNTKSTAEMRLFKRNNATRVLYRPTQPSLRLTVTLSPESKMNKVIYNCYKDAVFAILFITNMQYV